MKNRQLHIGLGNALNERLVVENIFVSAVNKYNLFDNTKTSRVPSTIKSIVEREGYGFGLGARIIGNSIIVDMFPNNSLANQLFAEVCEYIKNELFLLFNNQIREVNENDFISTH